MGEKRGGTEKIQFDFDTTAVMEVLMGEDWFRTTASDFRAFDGRRRLTYPISYQHRVVDIELTTEEYEGPLYLYATNIKVGKTGIERTVRDLSKHQKL